MGAGDCEVSQLGDRGVAWFRGGVFLALVFAEGGLEQILGTLLVLTLVALEEVCKFWSEQLAELLLHALYLDSR